MKSLNFFSFAPLCFLLSLTSIAAPTVDRDKQRIGLCGELHSNNRITVLVSPGLPAIQISGLNLSEDKQAAGICMVGPELPEIDEHGTWKFHALKAKFSNEVSELLGSWLAPIKVCGTAVRDGGEVFLQYGPRLEQKIYLQKNKYSERLYRQAAKGLPLTYCALGKEFPTLRSDGKLEFSFYRIQGDAEKSGFSVGNL